MKTNAFGLPTKGEEHVPAPPSKAQMLSTRQKLLAAQGNDIVAKALQIALDDNHPGQTTALKMCMDRLLPMSEFEAKKDGSRTAIQITISGVGDTVVKTDAGTIEGEVL